MIDLASCGFYRINGIVYFDKIHAMEVAKKTGQEIEFDFNDDFWSLKDWKQPSSLSLTELYRLRAEQIRNKHDHIALCLSGGADSVNVLSTFDKNNIKLDEIICWHNHSLSADWQSIVSGEVVDVAIPMAKEYISRHPDTTLTIIDQLDAFKETMKLSDEKIMQLMSHSPSPSSLSAFTGSWVCTLDSFKKRIDTGKSFGLIWGAEKTFIRKMPGLITKYGFSGFNEVGRAILIKNTLTSYSVTDEFFYWSIDFSELIITQCHILKEHLDKIPLTYVDPDIQIIETNKSGRMVSIETKTGIKIGLRTINLWLYGQEVLSKSSRTGKPNGSLFLSPVDDWMKNAHTTSEGIKWLSITKQYMQQFLKVGNVSNTWILNKTFGKTDPSLKSKSYLIE